MANKIEVIGTSLVMTDTVSGIIKERRSIDYFFNDKELINKQRVEFYNTNSTSITEGVVFSELLSSCIDKDSTPFTEQSFRDFVRVNFKTASGGSGASKLLWLATGDQEQNKAIVQDAETLIELNNDIFASYNSSGVTLDLVNNWIDVSSIDNNAWITLIISYLGVLGDADVTPSIRLIPDRNDLSTFITVHGQSSKQKNGKTSSYTVEGFDGGTDVIQIFVETDKNETLSIKGVRLRIDLP